jgi:two-component system sensor histidine kinase ChiS
VLALSPAEPPRPGQRTLLLVDDEALNRQVIGSLLRRQDYHVLEAQDGYEALEVLEERVVDLVLLDIMMPRLDGFATCLRIRAQYPPHRLPVLMLTAMPRARSVAQGFRSGANDYIEKPVREEELLARVAAHVELKDLAHLQRDRSLLLQLRRSWEASREQLAVTYANRAALRHLAGDAETGLQGSRLGDLFEHDLTPGAIGGGPVQFRGLARAGSAVAAADLTIAPLSQARESIHLCLVRPPAMADSVAGDGRAELVELMNLTLTAWERLVGRDRFELAEESRLWRVQVDDGRLRTRVMDRYCRLQTLPRYPRWKDVVKTAEYVLARAGAASPEGQARLAALRAKADAVRRRMTVG